MEASQTKIDDPFGGLDPKYWQNTTSNNQDCANKIYDPFGGLDPKYWDKKG